MHCTCIIQTKELRSNSSIPSTTTSGVVPHPEAATKQFYQSEKHAWYWGGGSGRFGHIPTDLHLTEQARPVNISLYLGTQKR